MKLIKFSQKYHKWLMLFLGAQFVIWSVTGAYMVFVDLGYIHGNSLVKVHQNKISPANINYSLAELTISYPQARDISIGKFINQDVYRFVEGEKTYLVDASNGKLMSPLSKAQIVAAGQHYYAGDAKIIDVELITADPPFELNQRHLPAWRIDFDNFQAATLYISAQHGGLVGKRHRFWRIFDWMFRLHIMDYGDAQNSGNKLLMFITLFAIVGCFTGLFLVYAKVLRGKVRYFVSSKDKL